MNERVCGCCVQGHLLQMILTVHCVMEYLLGECALLCSLLGSRLQLVVDRLIRRRERGGVD